MFSVPDKEENRDNGGYLLYEKLLSFDGSSENASQLDPGLWYTAGIWRKRCGFCTADLVLLLVCASLGVFLEEKEITIPVSCWWINLGELVLLLAIPSMLYLTKGQEEHYATIADESRDYFFQGGSGGVL